MAHRKSWKLPWMLDGLLVVKHFDLREDEKPRVYPGSFICFEIHAWLQDDDWTRRALFEMYEDATHVALLEDPSASKIENVIKPALLRAFDDGVLVAIRGEAKRYVFSTSSEAPAEPQRRPPAEARRFSLELVDNVSGEAIADIGFVVNPSNARQQDVTTNNAGRVEISDVSDGVVSLASKIEGATLADALVFVGVSPQRIGIPGRGVPERKAKPKHLVRVTRHRIKAGDSLREIAKNHKLSLDALAFFNWQTSDRREIKKHLPKLGCAFSDADGAVVFESAGVPGIIHVPRPVTLNGLELNAVHVVRTRPALTRRGFLFSG